MPLPSPMELLRTLNEITNIKCLAKYLVYGKSSINISFYYCYCCYINERLLFSFYIENYSIIVSLIKLQMGILRFFIEKFMPKEMAFMLFKNT